MWLRHSTTAASSIDPGFPTGRLKVIFFLGSELMFNQCIVTHYTIAPSPLVRGGRTTYPILARVLRSHSLLPGVT
jgi:hypothetical protein